MIVAERKEKAVIDKFDRFGEAMPDGRLEDSLIYFVDIYN